MGEEAVDTNQYDGPDEGGEQDQVLEHDDIPVMATKRIRPRRGGLVHGAGLGCAICCRRCASCCGGT